MSATKTQCGFGCIDTGYPFTTINRDCPIHNPINVTEHSRIEKEQEPIRAELRHANTAEAIRNRAVAALQKTNGHV